MDAATLVLISIGGCASIFFLLNHIPLKSTIFGRPWSPKLLVARLVAPFDVVVTMLLIAGVWVGITTVTGIGSMIYNVLTGLGLSCGAIIVRKFFIPKWQAEYARLVEEEK